MKNFHWSDLIWPLIFVVIVGMNIYGVVRAQAATHETAEWRAAYESLDNAVNNKMRRMIVNEKWYCGQMVISCNEHGYINMEGNLPTDVPAT